MSINDSIKDDVVDHAATVRLYEEGLQRMIDDLHTTYRQRMRRTIQRGGRITELEGRVRTEVNRLIDRSFRMLSPELRAFISSEADFTTGVLDRNVGEIWRARNTPKTPLRNLVLSTPLRDSRVLERHFRDIGVGARMAINSGIRRGIAQGLSHDEIARSLNLDVPRYQSRALVRTAVTQFATTAQDAVYRANQDVLRGFQYVATLDARTTPICSRNDGRVFDIDDETAPRPPLHWNCRSTTIPVTKMYGDIDPTLDQVKTGAFRSLSPRRRATMSGQASIVEDYDAWLRRQTYEVQVRHLGNRERVDLFREGNLKLRRFTNPNGRFISIDVLRRLNAQATQTRNPQTSVLSIVCDSPCKDFNNPEDFQVETEQLSPHKPDDFYNLRDSEELTQALIRSLQYEYSRAGLGDIDFIGNSARTRAENRRRFQTDTTNNGFVDPLTGEFQSAYQRTVTFIHEVEDDVLRLIRDDDILTSGDRDYLLGLYERLKISLPGPSSLASIQAIRSAFRTLRRDPTGNTVATGQNTVRDLIKANLYSSRTGAVDDISSRLQRTTTRGQRELQRLRADDVQILGNDRISIDDLIDEYPRAQARLEEYRVSPSVVERIRGRIQDQRGQRILTDIPEELLEDVVRNAVLNETNDWTVLSANIGKRIYRERAQEIFPDLPDAGTPTDFWRTGDTVIQAMADEGLVSKRILSNRTSRTLDEEFLNSGTNTIQVREVVEWSLDEFTTVKRDSRIVTLRNRVGYDDDSQQLVARSGRTTYLDNDGNDTLIPVRTRGLTREHNAISGPIARALNNNNNREYRVDPTGYGSFMQRYLTTSISGEPLNLAQREVLRRNQSNHITVLQRQLERVREDPEAFWTNNSVVHEGGRLQSIGILSDNSGEFWRPAFVTQRPVAIGESGWRQLRERLAVLVNKTDLNNEQRRLDWFETERDEILELGRLVDRIATSSSPNPRADIRRLNENRLWNSLAADGDANEQLQFGFIAQEIYRIGLASGRNSRAIMRGNFATAFADRDQILQFQSRVLPELDASESGQGIIAVLTRDRSSAMRTNVITQGENERIRALLAERLVNDPYIKANFPYFNATNQVAKLVKDSITTSGYGSRANQRARRVADNVAEALGMDDTLMILDSRTTRGFVTMIDEALAREDLNDSMRRTLRQLRKELTEGQRSNIPTQEDLLSVERYFDPETREVIRFLNQNNGDLVTYTQMRRFGEITQQELSDLLPGLDRYNDFMSDLFASFLMNSPATRTGIIPVRSADGAINNFQFLSKERLSFTRELEGGRMVTVSYNQTNNSTVDLAKARSAASALFTHSQDAFIARQHAARGRGNVYDGFTTTPGQLDELLEDTRDIYATMLEDNPIRQQLDLLLRNGWSREQYDIFINRLEGIQGDLTRDDITGGGRSYLVD